jgi:hypothetical protein
MKPQISVLILMRLGSEKRAKDMKRQVPRAKDRRKAMKLFGRFWL